MFQSGSVLTPSLHYLADAIMWGEKQQGAKGIVTQSHEGRASSWNVRKSLLLLLVLQICTLHNPSRSLRSPEGYNLWYMGKEPIHNKHPQELLCLQLGSLDFLTKCLRKSVRRSTCQAYCVLFCVAAVNESSWKKWRGGGRWGVKVMWCSNSSLHESTMEGIWRERECWLIVRTVCGVWSCCGAFRCYHHNSLELCAALLSLQPIRVVPE